MFKTKILVVGPPESGKTYICNFLSEATENRGGEYRPTQGVRILEFESEGDDPNSGKNFKAEVELWDCSGNKRFETCWPAFSRDVNGVLIVYNPDKPLQELEIEKWYIYFVKQQHLKDSQCLIYAHQKPKSFSTSNKQLSSPMLTAVKCVHTNLETDPEVVRDAFSSFLSDICSTFKETQDQVEQVIVSQHK